MADAVGVGSDRHHPRQLGALVEQLEIFRVVQVERWAALALDFASVQQRRHTAEDIPVQEDTLVVFVGLGGLAGCLWVEEQRKAWNA